MAGLVHQAFLYESPDDFVATMAPFVREGLEREEMVFAATKRPNIEALREELGSDAGLIALEDATEWQTRPYGRLQAFRRLIDELPEGRVMRAMGEPVWNGSEAAVREWARYEAVINLALADSPMRFVCLYDGAALPDEIIEHAVRTHPERMHGDTAVPCGEFVPPERFVPGQPPAPPPGSVELPLDGRTFRRKLAERAREAGLAHERIERLVLAATEVATNARRHGRPPIRAHVWPQGDELVCRIADAGPGIADPLAGWLPPESATKGGWGLPIARQLCDAVDIVPGEAGTVVSLHVGLEGP